MGLSLMCILRRCVCWSHQGLITVLEKISVFFVCDLKKNAQNTEIILAVFKSKKNSSASRVQERGASKGGSKLWNEWGDRNEAVGGRVRLKRNQEASNDERMCRA